LFLHQQGNLLFLLISKCSLSLEGGKTVSKLLGLIALAGLMSVGLATASHAQLSFTLTQPTTAAVPANADSFLSGIPSDTALFTAFLGTVPSQSFTGDSSVSFGTTSQLNSGTGTDSYTNVPANFTFDLTVPDISLPGGVTKSFQVQGIINGTSMFDGTNGASDAFFSPVTILVDGVATGTVFTISPAGRGSLEIANLDFGNNTFVDVFFDQLNALTAPGGTSPLSVGGFVRSSVTSTPEPGTMAMLVGMGVSGSVFLGRKRRRA